MSETSKSDKSSAKDHYAREKARRAKTAPVDEEAMASARREYQALLETNAAKGRGGRPKKSPPKGNDTESTETRRPEDE